MVTEEKKQVLEAFKEGRNFYKLMRFDDALSSFARALKIDPEDGPSKVYYARCKHYIENPPPEDWDGVFVMKTK
ncbi:MAG TPA: tetratricopeptide repeat protein [Spirochaetia bacterium]